VRQKPPLEQPQFSQFSSSCSARFPAMSRAARSFAVLGRLRAASTSCVTAGSVGSVGRQQLICVASPAHNIVGNESQDLAAFNISAKASNERFTCDEGG
jgi:hypothetical protein